MLQICWSSSWNSHFANLLNLMHACQASQGWPVLKSGEALGQSFTQVPLALQALALLYHLVIWLA